MSKSAVVTGFLLVVFGIWLFFKLFGTDVFWLYLYPVVVVVVGVCLIIFYRSEDRIEERED